MKPSIHKLLAAALLMSASAISMSARNTLTATMTIDFEDYTAGTYDGIGANRASSAPNDVQISADPTNSEHGNVIHCLHGWWTSLPRIKSIEAPKGFTVGDIVRIEASYYTGSGYSPGDLTIQLKECRDEYPGDITKEIKQTLTTPNQWLPISFDIVKEDFTENANKNLTSFGLNIGIYSCGNWYYIDDVVIYFEKEVSQQEMDEAYLDKDNAQILTVDFNNWNEGEIKNNLLTFNAAAKGADFWQIVADENNPGNKYLSVGYGGNSAPTLSQDILKCPDGYTAADLRLIEMDIYNTSVPNLVGDYAGNGNNPAPMIALKEWLAWGALQSDICNCGNTKIPVDQWTTVQFAPSAISFSNKIENNEVKKTADEIKETIYSKNYVVLAFGFWGAQACYYVDNIKLYFQKSGAEALGDIITNHHLSNGGGHIDEQGNAQHDFDALGNTPVYFVHEQPLTVYYQWKPATEDEPAMMAMSSRAAADYIAIQPTADGEWNETETDQVLTVDRPGTLTYYGTDGTNRTTAVKTLNFVQADGINSGIDRVGCDESAEDPVIYNLQGMRVDRPTPGHIYIIAGKKVLVK